MITSFTILRKRQLDAAEAKKVATKRNQALADSYRKPKKER